MTQRRSYNAAVELIDANVTRGLSDNIAFIDPDRSVTYGGLKERTCRFARSLRDLGVEPENRAAILMHDTIDYPVVFWGVIRSGAVAVPLNTYLSAAQYAYILADCRASALVVSVELADTIAPLIGMLPQLKHVVLVGGAKDRLTPFALRKVVLYEEVIAAASPEPFTADTISDEVAFWLYTSGSTGDPKGVRHVHSSLMATAKL